MRINLRIFFRMMLPLLALLIGSATARAQDEEGVKYTLTTRCIPADAMSGMPTSSQYAADESVYMSAYGQSGFKFIQWEDEAGNEVSTSTYFYYTMPARDVTLIARFEYDPDSPIEPTFEEPKKYATVHLDMTPAEGCSYIYSNWNNYYDPTDVECEVGKSVSFSANANTGFKFVNWTENGEEISTSSSISFTVEEGGRSIVANFVYDPTNPSEPEEPKFYRMLTLKANPAEAVYDFTGAKEHPNGDSFTVSASPNDYYVFENWTDEEGNVVSETQSFSYTMPNKHTTLTANYHYDFNPASPDEPGSPSIDDNGIVGKPRMTMKDKTHVMILCSTPGATIHFTLDGTEPTTSSDIYTEPVFVPGNITVKAIAVKDGMTDSEVTTYQVTSYRAAMPVFTFENQKIKISTTTENATIRYTIDNSDPTADSQVYTAPLDPEEDVLLKAMASRDDLTDSDIAVFVFNREEYLIAAPVITPQDDGSILITPSVEGGETRYTIDGTDPTASSTLYTEPLKLDGNFTVKAYTIHPNYYDSPVSEYVQYGFVVETPTYEYVDLALTLATATVGAEIRYTVDGSEPTIESALYTAPLALTEDCKVTARGFKTHYVPSDSSSYTFVYADHVAAAPVLIYDTESRTVTMTCDTENAEIRYTVDGEAPTAETGIKYEGPVTVVGSHIYRARAFRSDLFASAVASVSVDQKLPVPTASYEAKLLTLSCTDAEATIHYTTDGTDPTAASAVYTEPLTMSADCTVKFIAVRESFQDSEIGTYEFKVADYQVSSPAMSFDRDALTLTIVCATENAEIRYTIDGEAPTAETGTVYTAPIPVTGNHTYRARAFRADLFDSEAATLAVADLKVAKPVVSHSIETLKATMTVATEGAAIRYTTDGSVPTESTGTAYTAPIDLNGNVTFTVRAFKADYLDSDTTVYVISNLKLPMPTATYGKRALTLACEDGTAQIRYTTDGTDPTDASALYSAPIPLTADCTVRFIAVKTGFVSSDEGSFAFRIADYRETPPAISKDLAGHKVTISHISGLQISVTLNGTARTVATPATLDVTPDMTEISAVTLAQDEDRYDSEPLTETLIFHKAPKLTSDGHTLRVAPGDGEPAAEAAELLLYIDGSMVASGASELSQTLNGFCAATARVQSNSAFISEVAELSVDAFNTGRLVGARNGHHLEEAIGTWGDKADSYTYLRILGDIDEADLKTIAALPALKTLHIDATLPAAADCKGVLAGSSIETIYSNAYPEGMLEGMPRLTTVMWGSADDAMPEGRLREAGNPNILFWTPAAETAPADATNVVTYSNAGNGAATDPAISNGGAGLTGSADAVTLKAGYPFRAHMPVKAARVEVEKTFSLPTVVDVCAGWETLTLPFDVQQITHETSGRIVPFARWNGDEEGPKPFWLYAAYYDGWFAADSIQAGVPYIISMPNSKDYVEGFNLAGKVTFSAADVMLGTDYSAPKTTQWKEGSEFTGTFMPVEEEGILSMNVKPEGDDLAGSAFTPYAETLPFGAYMWAPGQPQSIPVFPDGNGVMLPTLTDGGLMVETPAPGTIRVTSPRDCRTAIVTPDGATVRTLSLRAGESVTVEGLTRGLYIVGGVKVMVR